MTEIATRPRYSHSELKLVARVISNAGDVREDSNDTVSLESSSGEPSTIYNDLKMSESSYNQVSVQEQQEDNYQHSFENSCLSPMDPGAINLPMDSYLDQHELCRDKGIDAVYDEKDAVNPRSLLDKSFVNLLDTSKGFDEGRCKKVGQYLLGRTIGEGSYGKVRLATHLLSKQRVAVKVVPKKTLVQNEAARRHFRREALMLQRLRHPHVTRLYQALETGNCYYLVFELAVGGSLLEVLSRHGTFSEQRSRHYMRQIVSALDHLHKSDIVHRDLKLENILLDEHSNVKLVDFGLSAVCQDSSSALSTQCGSPLYAAPEVFAGRKYGKAVDVWSLGVCLYALLLGRLPFLPKEGASLLQLYSLILKGCEIPETLSQACKELLRRMLEVHESRRFTLDEILVHPWLKQSSSSGKEIQPVKRVPPVPKQLNEKSVDFGIVKYICTMFRFSERDVVTSVLGRKLTPAAATYQIIHDSIEAGRMSILKLRDATTCGVCSYKETKSAPANLAAKVTNSHPNASADHVLPDIRSQSSYFPSNHKDKSSSQMDGHVESSDNFSQENMVNEDCPKTVFDATSGSCTACDFGDSTGSTCKSSDSPTRRTTSESTDSGVGVDLMPDEIRAGVHGSLDAAQPNPKLTRQFSYKSFIMDLRQSRQKFKTNGGLKLNTFCDGAVGKGNFGGDQYVILGHSPRNPVSCDKDLVIGDREKISHPCDENKQTTALSLPILSASSSGCFSPTFPPIACAVSSPNSQSLSSSSPVYSTIGGLGQQCVKYNTFINSAYNGGSGGSFYYSSKPIPGFRHGNRYFLHLDKSNFTASNMAVMGIPSSTLEDERLSCESFAPESIVTSKVSTLNRAHNQRDATHYPVFKPYSQGIPPPPPNSQSCSPFSYLSGEKIELKAIGVQGKCMGPNNQLQSPTLRIRTNNNSSLQIQQLHTFSKNIKSDKYNYSNSESSNVYSHTDVNTDVNFHQAPKATYSSVQNYRQPVRILASLRDLYGIDPWKRSKSEKTDLSRAVKKGQKEGQSGTLVCDISPTVRNPDYNNNRKEGSRRRRRSKSNRNGRDGIVSTMRLGIPDEEDGNESSASSRQRSNVSTPVASEREDFMMPVTSVTIRTIGRP